MWVKNTDERDNPASLACRLSSVGSPGAADHFCSAAHKKFNLRTLGGGRVHVIFSPSFEYLGWIRFHSRLYRLYINL
ncbi:hypothetical protein E2C01_027216 [Portunus trituberculatus]|uniref:Uncharacterized protein n=1 Tax=Portunus trituberculatus TaxID=210409 RepID=A0A5B7EL23_PORTR|nr:hypothetical protein [Portunus trituberculatus]